MAGLPDRVAAQLTYYESNKRVSYGVLTESTAKALNDLNEFDVDEEAGEVYFTARNVTAVAPGILKEVEEIAKLDTETNYSTEAGRKKLVGLIRDVLKTHQRTRAGFLFGIRNVSAPEFFSKAIDEQGNVVDRNYTQDEFDRMAMTPKQYREYRRVITEIKNQYLGRPMAEAEESENVTTAEALQEGYESGTLRGQDILIPKKAAEERRAQKAKEDARKQKLDTYRGSSSSPNRSRMSDMETTIQTFQAMGIPFQ